MAPFGGLGATLEPARYQGRKLHPNLTPQAPKMRPIWIPKETLRANKIHKVIEECSKDADKKNNGEKSGIRTLPNLKNCCFTNVKHTFSEIHLIPKKSQK